jgi:hypothetical protein
MVVQINAYEWIGMLVDLMRTAAKDAHPAVLNTVHFYTTEHQDKTVLVGESSNRFIAGQAWEPVTDDLPPTVLALRDAKAAHAAIKGLDPSTRICLTVSSGRLVMDTLNLRLEYPTLADATFPNLAGLRPDPVDTDQIAFNHEWITILAAIAKRRQGVPVRFVFAGRQRCACAYIGSNYQALVMPFQNSAIEDPVSMLAPPAPTMNAAVA